jgi:hypothetical protein
MRTPIRVAPIAGLLFVVILAAAGVAQAALTPQDLWRDVDETLLAGAGERLIVPDRYRTLALDTGALRDLLATAPMEFSGGEPAVVALPMPDGSDARFRFEESPILQPGLAARYPEIKTYRAQGVDNPAATARFGWTAAGFHAIVLSPSGTVYIDPYRRGDAVHYISYFKRDFRKPDAASFRCEVHKEDSGSGTSVAGLEASSSEGASAAFSGLSSEGGTLRTYRLAQAANFEYTLFHSGGVPNLPDKQAAINNGIVPTINRVNAIYERELAVHMNLIDDLEAIVWDQPADPYVNEEGISMLVTNQATLDALIGNANYDIGHVFSTGGGGVAGLGVVCDSSAVPLNQKAWGVTGLPRPVGDPFDVDFVAHEMGHQFGGNHTFNGTSGSCSGNDNPDTAFEVGSGSTIQAYAGICSGQNLQPHSDDYFHNISYVEMRAHTTGPADACAVKAATGNTPPVVEAGLAFVIPRQTPFTLTGSGSDPDGDQLTYCWEELDRGPANDGRVDNGSSPILRSFPPTTSPSRTFPRLADLLDNTPTYGELLPSTNRTMRFRVTARDNKAAGGEVAWDETQVQVTTAAGPFRVSAPNGGEILTGGSLQTVTWDVANTTAPPVSAAAVNIRLSQDGGLTFPFLLAAAVPNDGVEQVEIPNLTTAAARIKVEAAGNIFFDVSNADWTIQPGSGGPSAGNDEASTLQDLPVRIPVLDNDTDPDGDPLTLVAVQSPSGQNGTAVLDDNGTPGEPADDGILYTPANGFLGVDTFTYTVSDGSATDVGTVLVTVELCPSTATGRFGDDFEPAPEPGWTVQTAVNENPASLAWQPLADPFTHSLAQAFASDGTTLALKDDRLVAPAQDLSKTSRLVFWHRFHLEDGFDGGVLEVSRDGGATWIDVLEGGGSFAEGGYNGVISTDDGSPIPGRAAWTGLSTFVDAMNRVEVDLGAFAGRGVLVRWRLAADPLVPGSLPGHGWWIDDVEFTNTLEAPATCPRAPLAVDDTAVTQEDTAVSIEVLANDRDANGDALIVGDVTQGTQGGAVVNRGDHVTYTPPAGFTSPPADSFTYTACDPGGLCDLATVTVTVQAVNHAPTPVDDAATTRSGSAVTIPVLANDTDPDGDALTLDSVGAPAHGTAVANADGTVTYTPEAGFVGEDALTYTVSDGELTAAATVRITVEEEPTGGEPSRASGSGSIPLGSGTASFGANAQAGTAVPQGRIRYDAGSAGPQLKGVVLTTRFPSPTRAELTGSCELADGSLCTYEAALEDHGEPGKDRDRFSIRVFDAAGNLVHQAEAALATGHVRIR